MKLFENNHFELMKQIAASETWHKHPDELLGEPFHPRMLLDQMAARMAYDAYKMKYRII